MTADLFSVYTYCKGMKNVSIRYKVDNMATINWINRKTGPSGIISRLIETFWEFCQKRKFWFLASYVPSK